MGESCWLWTGAKQSNGYGMITKDKNGTSVLLHRLFYETFKGEIPQDKEVQHLCNTRLCINPTHLIVGTRKQNVDYMVQTGRDKFTNSGTFRKGHAFYPRRERI